MTYSNNSLKKQNLKIFNRKKVTIHILLKYSPAVTHTVNNIYIDIHGNYSVIEPPRPYA